MSRIAVTGAAGPVGSRLCAVLAADPTVEQVIAIDRVGLTPVEGRVVTHHVALLDADLEELFRGIDTVCHLAGSDPLEDVDVDHDLRTTSRVLDAASKAGVTQILVRTTAAAYGGWADNPVPITEAEPLRADPDCRWCEMRVAIERRIESFADDHPEIAVAVLRPTLTVTEAGPDELGRVLAAGRIVAEHPSPAQYVHADDVASAIDLVRRTGSIGVFNVAPDGAVDAERLRALTGGAPRLRLPGSVARRLGAFGWRHQLAPTPPGFLPLAEHPWIVANDRLRAIGWVPTHSNEEAYVLAHPATAWAQISPQRRQELALGLAGGALLVSVTTTALLIRAQVRRRR